MDVHFDGAGKDQVIGRIASNSIGCGLRRWNPLVSNLDKEFLYLAPTLLLKLQLAGEDALQLHHDWLCEDELQATVNGLFDDAAWRAGRDEGGDQDVGVAENAQGQLCAERISSTNASLSSGPMPSASARSRP